MEDYLLAWLSLLLRWAHVGLAMAWIGTSFYFARRDDAGQGAQFTKWPAYWTWLTGFALLVAVYYLNAELYLVDPQVMPLSKWAACGIGVGALVAGYSIYEGICRSPLGRREALLAPALMLFLVLAAWGLALVFGTRGVFIHYGAMLGTIMAANLAHVIIPARNLALVRQRSAHNVCLALPAVLAMTSGHYPIIGHWLALVALTLAGAAVGAWLLTRRGWILAAGLVLAGVTAFLLKPA